jgi:hypothetical protein
MKLYKFLMITLALTVLATSCKDAEPNIPYNVFTHGAYARTIGVASGNIPLTDANFNVNDGIFTATVQVVDERDGDLLSSMDVYVKYTKTTSGAGPASSSEVLLRSIPASAFTKQAPAPQPGTVTPTGRTDGKADRMYPTLTFSVTAPEAGAATGIDINALTSAQAGDAFDVRLVLNLTDGRTFTNSNSNGDVTGGPFYNSPFFYRVPFICGLPAGFALGSYSLQQTAGPGDPFFGNSARFIAGNVTLTMGASSTLRVFPVNYLGNFPANFTFNLVCNRVAKPFQSAGVGCTAGNPIAWTTDTSNPGFYDESDDSVIVIRIIDDVNSSCGALAQTPIELTLTKN